MDDTYSARRTGIESSRVPIEEQSLRTYIEAYKLLKLKAKTVSQR